MGAGPAGSLCAHRLACGGASVLLLDRARFPRDKPCGGGVTIRAARLAPFALDPVVEDRVERVELRFGYGRRRDRVCAQPVILMTQRRRLDRFLAEQAAAAGAEFRDGARVTGVAAVGERVVAEVDGRRVSGLVLVGADGANGTTARSLHLCEGPVYGVALEGCLAPDSATLGRYRGGVVFELGNVPGGYGWVFPKAEHLNVGVGGLADEAPRLRDHLRRLCAGHGFRFEDLHALRGYRLPLARADAVLAHGRTLVVGDAAGLVDPLSGDGIYGAFLSARLAADATLDVLAGRAADGEPYAAALRGALGRERALSWAAKVALERFPRALWIAAGTELAQDALERLARGEPRPVGTRARSRLAVALLRAALRAGRTDWSARYAATSL